MNKVSHLTLILFVIFTFISSCFCITTISYKNNKTTYIEELAYKQEIIIPIDTSQEDSKFQPIDTTIEFSHSCWAKNQTIHSVRVGFENEFGVNEIESQIYDLEYSDDSHITSCNLVFLIPENANGKEKYFVYYDSDQQDPPDYPDYISIRDTNYFYEPISGQVIEFDYYEVKEEGEVVYAVIQRGQLLGNPVSQSVMKMKPGSKFVETYNIQQMAGFDIRYGIISEPGYYGTTYAENVKKRVLVDGNLMAKMRIEGQSPNGDTKTDNIFTYYHCPTSTKKISVNVYHEILKTIDIEDPIILDGALSGIVSIKSRSATIEKMNAGKIMPSMTIYAEDETIKNYMVPANPDSITKDVFLSTDDDIDLGSKGWISLDDKSDGESHALIIDRISGFDKKIDGIQIKAYGQQNIKLPGLEADTGSVFMLKNNYEKGGKQDTILEQGYSTNFNIEFVNVQNEGNEKIDSESETYQTLIKHRPNQRGDRLEEEEEEEKYSITATVHFAPSFPLGSLLSAALGRNFPYIYAEIYKANSFRSSGSVGRLPLGSIELDLEGKNIFQKLRTIIGLFDWKNASLFKKISFRDLEPGTYIVKVFRQNLIFGRERKFIGYEVVDLKKHESIRITCRPQGSVKSSVFNQDKQGVENVKIQLLDNDVIISESFTDSNGKAILNAPCFVLRKYRLRAIYQGFMISEKNIRLGYVNNVISMKEDFLVDQHNLRLNFKDKWNFIPEIEINPTLSSKDMIEENMISAEKIGPGEYELIDLYPGNYDLRAGFKSFEIKEDIDIKDDETLDIIFPAEYEINVKVLNSYGESISDGTALISRKSKTVSNNINNQGETSFLAPPATYELSIFSEDDLIARQKVLTRGNKNLNIVSTKESQYHNIFIYLGIILAISALIFIFLKKNIYAGVKIIVIALLIIAIFSSWWGVTGEQNTTTSNTKTLLIPSKIVTLTTSSNILGGEISQVPEEVTMVLGVIALLMIVTSFIILLSIFTYKKMARTSAVLAILCIIFLILVLVIFTFAMSQITEVSVGGLFGEGDIETTIPGLSENVLLPSTWGPETGFYLTLAAVVILIVGAMYNRIISNPCEKWIIFPRSSVKNWTIFKK